MLKSAFSFVLLALFPAAAIAQYGAPSAPPRVPEPRGAINSPAAPTPGDVLPGAICQIGREPSSGDALLAAAPKSDAERTQAATFIRNAQRCLRAREPISATVTVLRGAVAEAVYESRFATPATPHDPALGAAPMPRVPANDPNSAVLAPMYSLVECATPRQSAMVRTLLSTEPRSPEEATALNALTPTFVTCVPAGTQLTIDPRYMRAFFAEALLRWSSVQRDGPASPYAAR